MRLTISKAFTYAGFLILAGVAFSLATSTIALQRLRIGSPAYDKIIADLRKNSVDYYAATRSIYERRRDRAIRDAADPEAPADEFAPIGDDELAEGDR